MSYFVFGMAGPRVNQGADSGGDVQRCLVASAVEAGLCIRFGKELPQVVNDMLSACAPGSALRFMLAASAGQDTSEELISPFADANNGIALMSGWLRHVCAMGGVVGPVALWISDGFDDRFIEVSCTAASFRHVLAQRLQLAGDIAPLHVMVSCAPGVRPLV